MPINFDTADYRKHQLNGLPSAGGFYHGQIIQWAKELKAERVLLADEVKEAAKVIAGTIGCQDIYTTGWGDVDYEWDFNERIPGESTYIRRFDLIISQAVIEHIVNPYGFIKSLALLLKPGGHMILHTVMPGFGHHAHPIDCLRFFPDWFEDVAKRLHLEVIKKAQWEYHIFYMYRR